VKLYPVSRVNIQQKGNLPNEKTALNAKSFLTRVYENTREPN